MLLLISMTSNTADHIAQIDKNEWHLKNRVDKTMLFLQKMIWF